MPENDPLLITVKAAAESLSLTPWSVYKLLDEGVIEGKYQGRRRYVLVASMRDYVAGLSGLPESA